MCRGHSLGTVCTRTKRTPGRNGFQMIELLFSCKQMAIWASPIGLPKKAKPFNRRRKATHQTTVRSTFGPTPIPRSTVHLTHREPRSYPKLRPWSSARMLLPANAPVVLPAPRTLSNDGRPIKPNDQAMDNLSEILGGTSPSDTAGKYQRRTGVAAG